jgi:hypothetical protein
MALILKQPGINPLGQFDGVDSVTTTVKGGEVGTFTSVTIGADGAAYDAADGYVPGGTVRPAITTVLPSTIAAPLGLIDDGIAGYGTLFGSVIGGSVGQSVTGSVLGPHTAYASGKLSFWTKPGTYGVTLDAVDTTLNSGLVPSNSALSIGDALFATVGSGLLTPNNASVVQDLAGEDLVVARFISFETNGSLVTTPVSLASAANSPVGLPAAGQTQAFSQAVFEFHAALA